MNETEMEDQTDEDSIESWETAATTYVQLADHHLKSDSKHEAARAYVQAAMLYKNTDGYESISCLKKAVNLYRELGKLKMVAIYIKEIAEHYESIEEIEQSSVFYEKALDFLQNDDEAYECKLKIAIFSVKLEQHLKAITIFEELAKQSLKPTDRVGHLLSAGICHLFDTGVIANPNALQQIYQKLDPSFLGTREYTFLTDLAAALAEDDYVKFSLACRLYHDQGTKSVDPWQITLLYRLKPDIKSGETEEEAHKAMISAYLSSLKDIGD